MDKLINSKYYQILIKIIDLIILNIIGAAISILSLGLLMFSAINSSFILSKELLYSSNHSLIKDFILEMKNHWKFNLKLTIYVIITMSFFLIYGYSIYALIFIMHEGFVGIMLLGIAITLFTFYLIHLINMFVFNSYFGFTSFSYTFKASLLIMSKRKVMSLSILLITLITSFITYLSPVLTLFGLVTFTIYLIHLTTRQTYEQLKSEEDERLNNEKLV